MGNILTLTKPGNEHIGTSDNRRMGDNVPLLFWNEVKK
jgi:hypothetical protein